MDNQVPFGIARYRSMRDRNADYSRALARTNLAIRCWLARVGESCRDESGHPPRHRMLAWMLANHIVQGFYRRIGIDVIPFSCGGMYGYGMSVGINAASCGRKDVGETAWIACGSVRVDSKVGDERQYPEKTRYGPSTRLRNWRLGRSGLIVVLSPIASISRTQRSI